MVALRKKGGIIIKIYNFNILLHKKKIIAGAMVILAFSLFSNKIYATNDTKDRIDEIKIQEIKEIEIDKLIRNEETNKFYRRNSNETSRSDINRNAIIEVDSPKYSAISDIKISKNMDLTVRTGISKDDFKRIMENIKQDTSKFFYNNAELIYDLCEKYEINEIFFCGLISAESGWNIAQNHRNTHNYISLMSNGKLIYYPSIEEGLEVAAKTLHNNYLTPGKKFYHGKTLEGVHKKFCPSNTWVNLVYGRMQQIMTAVNKIK